MKLKKKRQGFALYSKLVSHSPQSSYLNFLNLQLQFGKIKKKTLKIWVLKYSMYKSLSLFKSIFLRSDNNMVCIKDKKLLCS